MFERIPIDRDRGSMPLQQAPGEFITEICRHHRPRDPRNIRIRKRIMIRRQPIREGKQNLVGEPLHLWTLRIRAKKKNHFMRADQIRVIAQPHAFQFFEQRCRPFRGRRPELPFHIY